MALTAHRLHKLQARQHYRDEPDPDLVTSFVLHQQALHRRQGNDGWRPQISDGSSEMRGTNQTPSAITHFDSAVEFASHPANIGVSAVQNQVRRQKRNAPRSLDSSLIRYAERDSIKDLTNSPIDSDRPEGQSAGRRLGPPKIDRRKTKDHEKDPKHRLGEPRVDRRKIKGYGKDYEHRPEEPKVDRRKIKEYEKKPRHKMKDPTTKKSREETRKEEARPIKKKKKKKGDVATRTKTDTLAEGFSSKHIGNQRISLLPNRSLGIFHNGRAASPSKERKGLPDLSFSEVNFLGNRNRRVSKTAEDSGAEEARRSHKRRREVEKKIHGPSRSEMTTRSRSRTTSMFDTNSHRQPTLPENRTIASVAVYDRRSSSHHSIIRHQDEHSGYSLLGAQSRFADGYDINSSYGDMEIATAHTPDAYIACREKIPVPDYTSVESTEGVEISPFLPDIEDKPVVHQHPEIKRPAHRVVKSSKQPTNPIIEDPLDELLRICEDIPTARRANLITRHPVEQHFLPAAGIQAVEVASRAHIAIEDAGYQPANQIPAEFAGSASSIHADAYHPQTHHGIAAITDHFYPQTRIADHELVHTGGQYYEKDAGQGLRHRLGTDDGQDGAGYNQDEIGFATSYHSYADVSSEFGYGDGESYPCDDNPTPGIYAWANNIPNEVLHEDMSYMEGESEPKHHQQQDDQRLVYQDPQGFAEDSIGIDLGGNFRGFWRPQRW